MKATLAGLLLSSTLIATPFVHAATTVEAAGFSLSLLKAQNPAFDMEVITQWGEQYTIALHGAETRALSVTSDGAEGSPTLDGSDISTRLALSVTPGYFIHFLTLETSYVGSLEAELPSPCTSIRCDLTDVVSSSATVDWKITQGSGTTSLPSGDVLNVDGTVTTRYSALQSYTTDFDLTLRAMADMLAYRTDLGSDEWGNPIWGSSSGSLEMRDMRLIMTVSQVPEPATYAMLLAGLGVAGWAARRRA